MATRQQADQCRTVVPLAAFTYLYSQLHPLTCRISRWRAWCMERWRWCARLWQQLSEIRGTTVLGTLLLLLFSVCALVLSLSGFSLMRAASGKVGEVNKASTGERPRPAFSSKELESLPEPVRRYLRYALRDGQPIITFCSLKQTGQFRLRANQGLKAAEGWKRVRAEQYFATSQPSYVWLATIHLARFLWIKGWDSYVAGKGQQYWKLVSAVTLVCNIGEATDRAALSRFLTESVFFPTALLPSEKLSWAPLSADSARATLSHAGQTCSAVFHFNPLGQVTSTQSADRPRQLDDGTSTEDKWTGYYSDYREVDGIMVPHAMEAAWNLVGGTFKYAHLQVTENQRWYDVEAKNYLLDPSL